MLWRFALNSGIVNWRREGVRGRQGATRRRERDERLGAKEEGRHHSRRTRSRADWSWDGTLRRGGAIVWRLAGPKRLRWRERAKLADHPRAVAGLRDELL